MTEWAFDGNQDDCDIPPVEKIPTSSLIQNCHIPEPPQLIIEPQDSDIPPVFDFPYDGPTPYDSEPIETQAFRSEPALGDASVLLSLDGKGNLVQTKNN